MINIKEINIIQRFTIRLKIIIDFIFLVGQIPNKNLKSIYIIYNT